MFIAALTLFAICNTFLDPGRMLLDSETEDEESMNRAVEIAQGVRFALCAIAVSAPSALLLVFLPNKHGSRWKFPLRLLCALVSIGMLALNALDDPVCCAANIRREMFADPDRSLVLATTSHGGHLAFYEGWAAEPWVDRVVTQFLTAALDRATVPLVPAAGAADADGRHRHT